MSAFKLYWSRIMPAGSTASDAPSLHRDPLLHPDLEHMSLTELADLPLMPEHLGRAIEPPIDAKPSFLRCA